MKRGYLYCNGVAAVGELFRRVGKLTQQWCPRESGKRKRRGHDTRRRRAARGAYVQSSFWNKKPQRGHISACTWVRERCYDPTESPRSPETARALGAKLSLAAASSGEPVYTRRIEVLFKLLRYAVDETADSLRDLGGGRPSKGHATAAHRVCIFLGTSLFFLLLL